MLHIKVNPKSYKSLYKKKTHGGGNYMNYNMT